MIILRIISKPLQASPMCRSIRVCGLLLMGLFSSNLVLAACPAGMEGNGTSESPCQIKTWAHLYNVRQNLNAHFVLNNSLDKNTPGYGDFVKAENGDLVDNGKGWAPIGDQAFTGVLDGAGFVVADLHINRPDEQRVGLFKLISSEESQVKNIRLENVFVTGGTRVGALAGELADEASVERVASSGMIEGIGLVGGLIGIVERRGSVDFAFSSAMVKGGSQVGGLTGYLFGTLTNSYVLGGEVQATGIRNGGLVGDVFRGKIINTYSANQVTGASAVLGHNHEEQAFTFSNNFWDIEVTNKNTSIVGEGKSTAEMRRFATFAEVWNDDQADPPEVSIIQGWQPPNNPVWGICEGANNNYPFLLWQFDENPCATAPPPEPVPVNHPLFLLLLGLLTFGLAARRLRMLK